MNKAREKSELKYGGDLAKSHLLGLRIRAYVDYPSLVVPFKLQWKITSRSLMQFTICNIHDTQVYILNIVIFNLHEIFYLQDKNQCQCCMYRDYYVKFKNITNLASDRDL